MSTQNKEELLMTKTKAKLIKKFQKGDRNAIRVFNSLNREESKLVADFAAKIHLQDPGEMSKEEFIHKMNQDDEVPTTMMVRAFRELTDLPWSCEDAACGLCKKCKTVDKNAVLVSDSRKKVMGCKAESFLESAKVVDPNINITEGGVICRKCFRGVSTTAQQVLELRGMFTSSTIFTETEGERSQPDVGTDNQQATSSSTSSQSKRAKPETPKPAPGSTEPERKRRSDGPSQADTKTSIKIPSMVSKETTTDTRIVDLDQVTSEIKHFCGLKERNSYQFLEKSKPEENLERVQQISLKDNVKDLKDNAPGFYELLSALYENPNATTSQRSKKFMDSKQEREETNIGSTASAFLNLRSNHRLALRATKCGLGLRALGVSRPVMKILNKQGVTASYRTTDKIINDAGGIYDKMPQYLKEKVEKNEHAEISEITGMPHLYFGRQSRPHKAIVNRTGGLSFTHDLGAPSEETVAPGAIKFKIGGDNIDRVVRKKFHGITGQDDQMHVFHVYYKPYEILAPPTMSDTPKISLDELNSDHILPTGDDFIRLLSVFKIMCSRVLVDRVPYLKRYSKHVVHHIGHEFSDVLKMPSIMVPLGILDINENSTQGITEILRELYKRVPDVFRSRNVKVVSGGDQLTKERQSNAQFAMAHEPDDPIHSFYPVADNWHATQIFLQRCIMLLHSEKSMNQRGTYTGNCYEIKNEQAATKSIKSKNQQIRSMFLLNTETYIVGFWEEFAAQKYGSLNDIEREFSNLSKEEFQKKMRIDLGVMLKEILDVNNFEKLLYQSDIANTFQCDHCGKIYTSKAYFIKHLRDKHGVRHPFAIDNREDHKYNYVRTHLFLGLLLMSFEDAIREGDGLRQHQMWKFLLIFFRQQNSHKYAFIGVEKLVYDQAIYSEKEAHEIMWNNTTGVREQLGYRVADDYNNELLNGYLIKLVGDKLTKESVIRLGRALSFLHEANKNLQADYSTVTPGKSKKQKRDEDFDVILKANRGEKLFQKQPGRIGFQGFEKFPANIYKDTKKKGITEYVQSHINSFRRRKNLHRDYRMNVGEQQLEIETQIDAEFVYDSD